MRTLPSPVPRRPSPFMWSSEVQVLILPRQSHRGLRGVVRLLQYIVGFPVGSRCGSLACQRLPVWPPQGSSRCLTDPPLCVVLFLNSVLSPSPFPRLRPPMPAAAHGLAARRCGPHWPSWFASQGPEGDSQLTGRVMAVCLYIYPGWSNRSLRTLRT